MAARRHRRVQVGEGLAIPEPRDLRQEAVEKGQETIGAVDEGAQHLAPVDAAVLAALVEPGLEPAGPLRRRQELEGQEIGALEVRALGLELRPPLGLHQHGHAVGKGAGWIAVGRQALSLDVDRPARAQAAQGVVEAGRDRHELGSGRRVQVRSPEAGGALEGTVLVEDDAGGDQGGPGDEVGEQGRAPAVFAQVEH